MLSVSHDTSQSVSIQSAHVMSRVCVYGPSPMRPWNSRSCSVPFSHCCSCFPLAPTQKLCPWRAIDFSRVISVFPFTGRKWNNNRGKGEKSRVTLGQTLPSEQNAESKMGFVRLSDEIPISTCCAGGDLRCIHAPKTLAPLCCYCSAAKAKWEDFIHQLWWPTFQICPNMRKLWWNPHLQFPCFKYRQETDAMSNTSGLRLVPIGCTCFSVCMCVRTGLGHWC